MLILEDTVMNRNGQGHMELISVKSVYITYTFTMPVFVCFIKNGLQSAVNKIHCTMGHLGIGENSSVLVAISRILGDTAKA